jgi:hypothetical protein
MLPPTALKSWFSYSACFILYLIFHFLTNIEVNMSQFSGFDVFSDPTQDAIELSRETKEHQIIQPSFENRNIFDSQPGTRSKISIRPVFLYENLELHSFVNGD